MDQPAIHYDRMMGIHPAWKHALGEALRGRKDPLEQELQFLSGFSPSGVQALAAMHAYAKCGQQAFCIGPRLQQMLSDTDCGKVPCQFFQVPYPCFYVATPGASWQLYGDSHTGLHRVGGLYVHQITSHELVFYLWGLENDKSRMAGDDATFWLSLDLDAVPTVTDDAGTVLLDFDTYIKTLLQNPSRGINDVSLDIPKSALQVAVNDVPLVIRVGINLVLYLNSLRADVVRDEWGKQHAESRKRAIQSELARMKSPGKKAKHQRRADKELASLSEAVIIWIGKSIEEAPEQPKDPKAGARPSTWKSRRGHWHHYWTGPRRNPDGSVRIDPVGRRVYGNAMVLKWVQPIYRDIADLVAARGHQYRFKEEKKDWDNE